MNVIGRGPSDPLYVVWELWQLHSAERIRTGLPAYRLDGRLWHVSDRFAREIAGRGVLTHSRASGVPFYREVWSALGRQVVCGENAASGQRSTREAMADWMGSSLHRANVLDPRMDTMGCALALSPGGMSYWVADFANLG